RWNRLQERDAEDPVVGSVDLDEVDPVEIDERRRGREEVGAALVDRARRQLEVAAHSEAPNCSTWVSPPARRLYATVARISFSSASTRTSSTSISSCSHFCSAPFTTTWVAAATAWLAGANTSVFSPQPKSGRL